MASTALSAIIVVLCTVGATASQAPALVQLNGPAKVVTMLQELQAKVTAEGKADQAAYDKYACWVEETLAEKGKDISDADTLIGTLGTEILQLAASTASNAAEIKTLDKDIAQNIASNKEATAARTKENAAHLAEKVDADNAVAALRSAIATMTGAGTKLLSLRATGFKLQDAASSLHRLLQTPQLSNKLSEAQLEVVSRFIQNPQDVASRGMAAVQTGQNPAGDYAPASDQIMGIFKGMVDSFTADLSSDAATEAASKRSFDKIIINKNIELGTYESSLRTTTGTLRTDAKSRADKKVLLIDTKSQMAADKELFEDVKSGAEKKATEWSTRTRLRNEEMNGMQAAIEVLQGGTVFLQIRHETINVKMQNSVNHMKRLAAQYKSASLQRVVHMMKTTGHFDTVMASIDKNMVMLRKEEQDDIAHRDRCETKTNDNNNDIADANAAVAKVDAKILRLGNEKTASDLALLGIDGKITTSKGALTSLASLRAGDKTAFEKAQKDSRAMASMLNKAAVVLGKFYKQKALLQMANVNDIGSCAGGEGDECTNVGDGPEATCIAKMDTAGGATPCVWTATTVDSNAAASGGDAAASGPEYSASGPPKTEFNGASHQTESTNIVAILNMLEEDSEKEIKEGKADEAEGVADYEKQRKALQATLDAQTQTEVSLEEESASLATNIAAADKVKLQEDGDLVSLNGANGVQAALTADCAWVATGFDDRRTKRKTEMDGLTDAKDFLAGVEAGTAVLSVVDEITEPTDNTADPTDR